MRGHQHSCASFIDLSEELENAQSYFRIKVSGRFIRNEKQWVIE
jgi:hypothetical protein